MNTTLEQKTETLLTAGKTIFFSVTEEIWNKPFVMKRHHVYDTRTVILKGEVIATQGNDFMVKLFGNNGFERDGETFVFSKGNLLSNQDFKDSDRLGKWRNNEQN